MKNYESLVDALDDLRKRGYEDRDGSSGNNSIHNIVYKYKHTSYVTKFKQD